MENEPTKELRATMESYRQRREKLRISLTELARELGFSGAGLGGWETLRSIPRRGVVKVWGQLLDELEAGTKTLQTSSLVGTERIPRSKGESNRLNRKFPARDLAVLLGVIRRQIGLPAECGCEVLGCSPEEFNMKEGGMMALSKKEIASLMWYYASTLYQGVSGTQLTFEEQLLKDEETRR